MENRTINVTEEAPGIRHDGREYAPGPQTIPKELADYFIAHGWAEDPETGEKGERIPGAAAPLQVNKVTQVAQADAS